MKIWCEECNGKGTVFPNVMARDECDNCNGKGYTEYEGSLEDLELGRQQVVIDLITRVECEHLKQIFPNRGVEFYNGVEELLNKFRQYKGGTQ